MSFGQHISNMAANTGQAHNFRPKRVGGQSGGVKRTSTETSQGQSSNETQESGSGQKTAYQNAVQGPGAKRRRRYGRHVGGTETAYVGGTTRRSEAQKARPTRRQAISRQARMDALDAKLNDTTRETQVRFLSQNGPLGGPSSNTGKLSAMVSRLITMCKNQLGQYTGDELYKRADYRLFLSAFKGLQGGNAEPADPWEGSNGGLRLSQTMTKAKGVLNMLESTQMPGDELEEVA